MIVLENIVRRKLALAAVPSVTIGTNGGPYTIVCAQSTPDPYEDTFPVDNSQ